MKRDTVLSHSGIAVRRCIVISALFIASCVLPAHSANFAIITFFIGNVLVKTEKTKQYVPASIGMKLRGDSALKTCKNSFVELVVGEEKFLIEENLNLSYSEIVAMKESMRQAEPGKGFFNGIKSIINTNTTRVNSITSTIAIKGKDADDDVLWDGDDKRVAVSALDKREKAVCEAIISDYEKCDYESVLRSVDKYAGLFAMRKDEMEYLAAFSCLKLCRYNEARRRFSALYSKGRNDAIKSDACFYAGLCSHCLLDFKGSRSWLTRYIGEYPSGELAAQAYFMRGLNHSILKEFDSAREDFHIVIRRFPGSPVSKDSEKAISRLPD